MSGRPVPSGKAWRSSASSATRAARRLRWTTSVRCCAAWAATRRPKTTTARPWRSTASSATGAVRPRPGRASAMSWRPGAATGRPPGSTGRPWPSPAESPTGPSRPKRSTASGKPCAERACPGRPAPTTTTPSAWPARPASATSRPAPTTASGAPTTPPAPTARPATTGGRPSPSIPTWASPRPARSEASSRRWPSPVAQPGKTRSQESNSGWSACRGRHPAGDLGAVARGGNDLDGAAERPHPVRYALQPGPHRRGGPVEAGAVVLDGERQALAVVAEAHPGRRRLRVLRYVLQGLQDAEVHRRLGLLRVPAQPGRFDRDRNGNLARLRLQRGPQSQVGQHWRVYSAGEFPQLFQCVGGLALGLREQLGRLG